MPRARPTVRSRSPYRDNGDTRKREDDLQDKGTRKSLQEPRGEDAVPDDNQSQLTGSCLGCGDKGKALDQRLTCGGPVEPDDNSSHYQSGWHDGPRESCKHPSCAPEDLLEEQRRDN